MVYIVICGRYSQPDFLPLYLFVARYRDAFFEARARLKIEYAIEPAFDYQTIHRRLSMLFLHFRQNQFGGIAVIKAAESRLQNQQLMCPLKCHSKLAAQNATGVMRIAGRISLPAFLMTPVISMTLCALNFKSTLELLRYR